MIVLEDDNVHFKVHLAGNYLAHALQVAQIANVK